jgi:hypothetical protein
LGAFLQLDGGLHEDRNKVSDLSEPFINRPARQLVGKTQRVFRQPHGLSTEWTHVGDFPIGIGRLDGMGMFDWIHSADGRPSGSSLQVVEEADRSTLSSQQLDGAFMKKLRKVCKSETLVAL